MEHEKMKRVWIRWPAIMCTVAIAILGIGMLHFAYTGAGKFQEIIITIYALGALFTIAGIGISLMQFFSAEAYTQKTKLLLDELEGYLQYKNGILLALNGTAKLVTYNHQKIIERGYVKIITKYNRKKKQISWEFLQ